MTAQSDTVQRGREERFRWDEENRLTALSQNGYVSHYWYDADGNLTRDRNKGIRRITYNVLNLPQEVTFADGHIIRYRYAADGRKLRTDYVLSNYTVIDNPGGPSILHSGGAQPMGGGTFTPGGDGLPDPENQLETTLMVRDYCGSHVYRDRVLERIMGDYGYMDGTGNYHYFIKDYQGNVRAVIDQQGTLEEVNNYYPYGGLMGGGTVGGNQGVQPYKYGTKELDRQNGLDWYDSQARMYDPLLGRTPTLDPKAEKYYSISPYIWCAGNPILLIDYTGKDGLVAIKNGQICISANIYLYGDGATKQVKDIFQKGVDEKWSQKPFAIDYNNKHFLVSVEGKFLLYGGKEKSNPIIIPESWNPLNRDNFIKVSDNEQRSEVVGGDEGQWRSKGRNGKTLTEDNPAAHEFGHILGLIDRYNKQTNMPNPGWENNIMGNSKSGEVENRNILEILRDALNEYENWIKTHNPEKEIFHYEINP